MSIFLSVIVLGYKCEVLLILKSDCTLVGSKPIFCFWGLINNSYATSTKHHLSDFPTGFPNTEGDELTQAGGELGAGYIVWNCSLCKSHALSLNSCTFCILLNVVLHLF